MKPLKILKTLKKVFKKWKNLFQRKNQSGILLVQAGIPGEWEPTQDEFDQITNTFANALSDPNNATIITFKRGVTAEFIPIPKEWFGDGWVIKKI